MKICFVIHGLSMGGAEKFLIDLVNNFEESGYQSDIILLSNDDELSNEVNKGINIYKIIRHNRYDITVVNRLNKLIIKNNYTTIFCINSYAFFFTRMAFVFRDNMNIILSPHTTKPFSFYKYLQNFIYYRFIRDVDKIIYLCENQRKYLKSLYKLKHKKEYVVYNGVNTKYFDSSHFDKSIRLNKRKELGIGYNEKIILQVARISPEKNQLEAIKSLGILHKEYKLKAHLIIVGGGNQDLIDELYGEIQKQKIKEYVHIVGNQKDVRPFYFMSDMFTLTSKSETFPISALEAMSFGLPCVLTNVGGVEEIIRNKENGRIGKTGNPRSIATEWNSVLIENHDKDKIRNYLKYNFSSERMFYRYKEIIMNENIT